MNELDMRKVNRDKNFIEYMDKVGKDMGVPYCLITETKSVIVGGMDLRLLSKKIDNVKSDIDSFIAVEDSKTDTEHPTYFDLYEYISNCETDIYGRHCLFRYDSSEYPKWYLLVSRDKTAFFLCRLDEPSRDDPKKILEFSFNLTNQEITSCEMAGINPIDKIVVTRHDTGDSRFIAKDSSVISLKVFRFEEDEIQLILRVLKDMINPKAE